jgi:glycosyltransferase involved in cell wall biosynthesis
MKVAFTFWSGHPLPPKGYGGFERILWYLYVELEKLVDLTCYCYPQWYPHWKFWTTEESEVPVNDYDAILNISNCKFSCNHVVNYEWGYGHTKNVVVPSRKESEIRHKPNKIVYFGTDVNYYRFNPNKEDYFIFFGRIHPSKGADVAVQIAKETGIKLKLMGADKEPWFAPQDIAWAQDLKEKCKSIPNVEYLGTVSNEEVVEYLGKAKAMIYPIQGQFMFDLTVIESLSCGTPVIVSNLPAPNELIEHGRTGFICPPNDISAWKWAIKNIDSIDPYVVRKTAEEKWSSTRMAKELVGLLEQVSRGETW